MECALCSSLAILFIARRFSGKFGLTQGSSWSINRCGRPNSLAPLPWSVVLARECYRTIHGIFSIFCLVGVCFIGSHRPTQMVDIAKTFGAANGSSKPCIHCHRIDRFSITHDMANSHILKSVILSSKTIRWSVWWLAWHGRKHNERARVGYIAGTTHTHTRPLASKQIGSIRRFFAQQTAINKKMNRTEGTQQQNEKKKYKKKRCYALARLVSI